MRIAMFGAKPYDRQFFEAANESARYEIRYFEPRMTQETCTLAMGFTVVCLFVNDQLDRPTAEYLGQTGTQLIAMRCAGYNNVDLPAVYENGMRLVRVPAYSPYAVAEHTLALIMTLNRKVHRAYNRVREGNFALEGLMGFDLHGAVVGVLGTGKIGEIFCDIMNGLGCRLLAFDPQSNPACEALGVRYTNLDVLLRESDIISLHCPLLPATRHIINADAVAKMKDNVMLINTSRGGLVDTVAVIEGLKSGKIGYLGLDVYEEEEELFFEDYSQRVLHDDVFARLLTFPNVVITGHQAFFTRNALRNIAETTLANIRAFERGETLINEVNPNA